MATKQKSKLMITEFKLNTLLRKIIENDYENSQVKFAEAMKTTKQEIWKFYNNKTPLSLKSFRKWADKAGYKIKIKIEKKEATP